jgi:hypothetical protein
MNYSWFILLIAILYTIYYGYRSIYTSLILILITKIIHDINILSGVELKNGIIQESKIFYKEYKNKLADIHTEVSRLKDLLKEHGLGKEKVYRVFALYIHAINGNEKIFKNAYIGIMRYKKTGYIEVNVPQKIIQKETELEESLFEHQFMLTEFPKTRSIWSHFNLRSEFSVFNVIKKYYTKLNQKISKTGLPAEVTREIELSKTFIILEIYSENDINFHIPVENYTQLSMTSNPVTDSFENPLTN